MKFESILFHHGSFDTAYLLKLGSGRIENACGGSAAAPKKFCEQLGNAEYQKAILDDSFTI